MLNHSLSGHVARLQE